MINDDHDATQVFSDQQANMSDIEDGKSSDSASKDRQMDNQRSDDEIKDNNSGVFSFPGHLPSFIFSFSLFIILLWFISHL